jgi:hypothetical protein
MHALHILRPDSEPIGIQTCRLAQSSAALIANTQVCTPRALQTANVLLDMYLPKVAKVIYFPVFRTYRSPLYKFLVRIKMHGGLHLLRCGFWSGKYCHGKIHTSFS